MAPILRRKAIWIALIVVAAIAAAAIWQDNKHKPTQVATTRLTVGYQTSPALALLIVADAKKLFPQDAGIELKEFQAGKLALQAFIAGSLDVAVAGDMPTGLALLQGQSLQGFVEVVRKSRNAIRMVVRSDRCDPDSAGRYFATGPRKRIATSFGGGPQYFAHAFLRANSIPADRFELVAYQPDQMVGALATRAVDGVAVFDPAAAKAEAALRDQGCTFADPNVYREHYLAVAKPTVVAAGDSRLAAFVTGLRAAQAFIAANPAEAKALVEAKTKIDPATLDKLWPNFDFGVYIDPRLPELWAQQAVFHQQQPGASFVRTMTLEDFRNATTDRYVR